MTGQLQQFRSRREIPVSLPRIDVTEIGRQQGKPAPRVAAVAVEDLFGPGEGRLGVSHPLGLSKRRQIAPEGVRRAQALQVGEELQFAGREGFLQVLQKQPAEQA